MPAEPGSAALVRGAGEPVVQLDQQTSKLLQIRRPDQLRPLGFDLSADPLTGPKRLPTPSCEAHPRGAAVGRIGSAEGHRARPAPRRQRRSVGVARIEAK
jgi:hypothetical protein